MTTMYDAVTPAAIPANVDAVGGYINGRYAWGRDDWDRFSGRWVPIWVYWPSRHDPVGDASQSVAIARDLGLSPGSTIVLDVEASDAESGAGFGAVWCDTVRQDGYSPTIYTSRSTWGTLSDDAHPDDWWIAEYNNRPHLIDGTAACQWTAPEAGSPGDYDLSECRDGWPRRGAPVPPPDPWPVSLMVPVVLAG